MLIPAESKTLGALVCRYAYDAVGRLMWKRTPTNEGLTALQRKDYYYDGVRRIQENITRPTLLMPDGGGGGGGTPQELELPSGPGNDELPVPVSGGGGQQIIGPPTVMCEEPPLPVGTLFWTDREYVYGPGYVDEFILQIDQDGVLLYMLQDANYNVVALVAGGWSGIGGPPALVPTPGTLLEQYAYDPYGTVIAADNLDVDQYGVSLHAVNRVGFQGLFFERYDGDYTVPCIAPDVSGIYYARNRFYSPALGRFLQRDPNETGIPIIAALAMNGEAVGILLGGFNGQGLYGDGMNLYLFAVGNPISFRDPSGLNRGGGAGGAGAVGLGMMLWMMAAQTGQVVWNAVQGFAGQIAAYSYIVSTQIAYEMSMIGGSFDVSVWSSALADQYSRFYNWATSNGARAQGFDKVVENASNSGYDPDNLKGDLHHAITRKIHRALENHETLKGHYQYRDPRFTSRAVDAASHKGYDNVVHRSYEDTVIKWLEHPDNKQATKEAFEKLLKDLFNAPEMLKRFPGGLGPAESFQ